ncbi:MAG: hypothetical protein ABIE68_01120 [bacterium]
MKYRHIINIGLTAFFLALIIGGWYFVNYHSLWSFGNKVVEPYKDFQYQNELTCYIVHSTRSDATAWQRYNFIEKEFKLKDLNSDNPKINMREDYWYDLKKVNDDEYYVLLQNTDPGFLTQTIGIMKDNGSMVRTKTETNGGTWKFHDAVAQKGRCLNK